jgi:hypothetical protein
MDINVEHTLQRRAAAILEIRCRTLARAGMPLTAAYAEPPLPSIQLETRIAWT